MALPTSLLEVTTLSLLTVRSFPCTLRHSLHITLCALAVGFTWAWGSGKRGQLGSEVLTTVTLPQRIEGLVGNRVLELACGYDFSVALTEKGLFVWGSGQQGQIPCDDPKGIVTGPTKIPLSTVKIASISCGRLHTAILTSTLPCSMNIQFLSLVK